MRVLVVIAAFLMVGAIAVPFSSMNADDLFESFETKYGKQYVSDEQRVYRKATFVANLAHIDYINSLDTGAVYGITEFADMSEAEFSMKYLALHHDHAHGNNFNVAPLLDATAAPDAVDWRTKGAVTPVKNQGQCGSCWSFSTTGNIEGQWFLKKGSLVSLSEQNLVDCDTVDQGCNGGLPSNAYQFITKQGGIDTEASYPYKAVGGKCAFSKSNIGATVSNWTALSQDETQLAAWLAANGPISIGINAMWMQFYMGGVSNPLYCNPKSLDHGVLIVGYGTQGTTDYWIIKNSWGATWGEQGYYRIVRGKGKCGLNTMCTSAII
jgi:cathepsin F